MPLYVVKQETVDENGELIKSTMEYDCESTEMSALVSKMDGKVKVLEENATLSTGDSVSSSINSTSAVYVENIVMTHPDAKTKFVGAYGKPLVFKTGTTSKDLAQSFLTHKPFAYPATAKPARVKVHLVQDQSEATAEASA